MNHSPTNEETDPLGELYGHDGIIEEAILNKTTNSPKAIFSYNFILSKTSSFESNDQVLSLAGQLITKYFTYYCTSLGMKSLRNLIDLCQIIRPQPVRIHTIRSLIQLMKQKAFLNDEISKKQFLPFLHSEIKYLHENEKSNVILRHLTQLLNSIPVPINNKVTSNHQENIVEVDNDKNKEKNNIISTENLNVINENKYNDTFDNKQKKNDDTMIEKNGLNNNNNNNNMDNKKLIEKSKVQDKNVESKHNYDISYINNDNEMNHEDIHDYRINDNYEKRNNNTKSDINEMKDLSNGRMTNKNNNNNYENDLINNNNNKENYNDLKETKKVDYTHNISNSEIDQINSYNQDYKNDNKNKNRTENDIGKEYQHNTNQDNVKDINMNNDDYKNMEKSRYRDIDHYKESDRTTGEIPNKVIGSVAAAVGGVLYSDQRSYKNAEPTGTNQLACHPSPYVFIGNVWPQIKKKDLLDFFKNIEALSENDVQIHLLHKPTGRYSNNSNNQPSHAFVAFNSINNAREAILLCEQKEIIRNHNIKANYARGPACRVIHFVVDYTWDSKISSKYDFKYDFWLNKIKKTFQTYGAVENQEEINRTIEKYIENYHDHHHNKEEDELNFYYEDYENAKNVIKSMGSPGYYLHGIPVKVTYYIPAQKTGNKSLKYGAKYVQKMSYSSSSSAPSTTTAYDSNSNYNKSYNNTSSSYTEPPPRKKPSRFAPPLSSSEKKEIDHSKVVFSRNSNTNEYMIEKRITLTLQDAVEEQYEREKKEDQRNNVSTYHHSSPFTSYEKKNKNYSNSYVSNSHKDNYNEVRRDFTKTSQSYSRSLSPIEDRNKYANNNNNNNNNNNQLNKSRKFHSNYDHYRENDKMSSKRSSELHGTQYSSDRLVHQRSNDRNSRNNYNNTTTSSNYHSSSTITTLKSHNNDNYLNRDNQDNDDNWNKKRQRSPIISTGKDHSNRDSYNDEHINERNYKYGNWQTNIGNNIDHLSHKKLKVSSDNTNELSCNNNNNNDNMNDRRNINNQFIRKNNNEMKRKTSVEEDDECIVDYEED